MIPSPVSSWNFLLFGQQPQHQHKPSQLLHLHAPETTATSMPMTTATKRTTTNTAIQSHGSRGGGGRSRRLDLLLLRFMTRGGGGSGGWTPPEPLATQGEWSAYLDEESTGLVYYFNSRTGESRWIPPTSNFPPVKLSRQQKQKAEAKQIEYRKAAQRYEADERTKGVNLAATLMLEDDDDATPAQQPEVQEKQEEWYDFLADRTFTTAKEEEPDWFGWAVGKLKDVKSAKAVTARSKQDEEPDWFSSFGDLVGKSASAASAAVEKAAAAAKASATAASAAAAEKKDQTVEPKKSFFVSVAPTLEKTVATATTTSITETETVEPQKQEELKKDIPEWFTWLKTSSSTPSATKEPPVKDSLVTEPPPPVIVDEPPPPTLPKEKKEKKPSVFERFKSSAPPAVVEKQPPPAVVEKPKIEKRKSPVIIEVKPAKKEEKVAVVVVPEEKVAVQKIVPEMAAYVLPDPKKLFWGGEDATFVKGRSFGVFDGVSGAQKLDGVPLYSTTLAREMKSLVGDGSLEIRDMIQLMESAVDVANKRATGASTALVGSVGEDGTLRILNVGDSTAIVIRDDKVVARTREINHFYECPYQFSTISPDKPRDGTKLQVPLKKGDLIIAGSDGVFDNLEEEQILKEVASSPKRCSAIAKRVSDLSRRVSQNPKAVTPFSKVAFQKKNPDYPNGIGGKVDDICCVAIRYG